MIVSTEDLMQSIARECGFILPIGKMTFSKEHLYCILASIHAKDLEITVHVEKAKTNSEMIKEMVDATINGIVRQLADRDEGVSNGG